MIMQKARRIKKRGGFMKYKDKIDLYDDKGKLLESEVPLEAISPLFNPAIESIK